MTTRILAGAFLFCGNKVLLIKRGLHKELGARLWAGVGGHLDIPSGTMKNIVSGRSQNPGIVTIKKICDGLEITIDRIFHFTHV